jgi:serine/threonine protein kinase
MHSRGFIHRDIKPENFLLGLGAKSHIVHLIDYGFTRRWKHSTAITYVPSSTPGEGLIGTLKYASKYAHLGQGISSLPFWLCVHTDPSSAQTRRDDLHSLVYTILLFARGGLLWDHIRRGTRKHCARQILEKKRPWTAERLCQGLPHELEAFSSYCFGLEISEEPNYHLLRDKLSVIANRERCNKDIKFEWDDPDWSGKCCTVMSAHSRLNMSLAAPIAPEPAPPLPEHIPLPFIKRGEIVFFETHYREDSEPRLRALPTTVGPKFLSSSESY